MIKGENMKVNVLIMVMMIFSVKAMACSCGAWDAQEIMAHADGVYVAMPVKNSRPIYRRLPPRLDFGRIAKTKMKVIRSYKGSNSEFVSVFHEPQSGTSCEFNFSKNDGVFVVITYRVSGMQITDMCSASQIRPNNTMVNNFLKQL